MKLRRATLLEIAHGRFFHWFERWRYCNVLTYKWDLTDEQRTAAQQLQRALSLLPIENPFEYVKSIQKDFDGSKIQYSDEYYEVTGIENPKGTNTQDKHLVEFEPVVFEFNRKQDSD